MEKLFHRKDYTQRKQDSIYYLQIEMEVVAKLKLWFMFKLIFVGTILNFFDPPEYIEKTRLLKDKHINFLGIIKQTQN